MLAVSGLGATAADVATIIQKIGPHIDTIALVVNDPAFPTLMERIKVLNALEASQPSSGASSGASISKAQVGVGLRMGVKAIDAVIFARQKPWAIGLVGAGAIVFIGAIGYAIGRRRK